MRIYTRAGDGGETDLLDGSRVGKFNARVEAFGTLDECNATLGSATALLSDLLRGQRSGSASGADAASAGEVLGDPADAASGAPGESEPVALEWCLDTLLYVQNALFDLGAHLANPPCAEGDGDDGDDGAGASASSSAMRAATAFASPKPVQNLEAWIDRMDARLPALTTFLLPGGAPGAQLSASLHVARTLCRRAERRVSEITYTDKSAVDTEAQRFLNRAGDYLFVMARSVNNLLGVHERRWQRIDTGGAS